MPRDANTPTDSPNIQALLKITPVEARGHYSEIGSTDNANDAKKECRIEFEKLM